MYTETRTWSTWYWEVKCTFQVWPEKQVLDPWEAMSLTAEEYGVKKHTAQRLKVFLFVMPNPA